ncbi:MAG: IclR family transcriptional regulator [Lawsonibacter sp.]|nr:IclR family transcriptional regulator [Lawsonibacter sp.]
MATSGSPVQSIDRVFDIVEALSSASHGLTLTDLSVAVGLHVSTTHRLLSSLVARGYVRKDIETGKYRLTMRLFEVGSRVVGGMNLVSVSRPFLEHLADFTGETIHLVARDGDEVVYLYKEDTSNSVIRMSSFVGLRSPMYCTAVGKSILAYLPEGEVKTIWDRTVVTPFTPNTIIHFRDLLAELERVRRQGYALDREEHELGVLCVAAPVFDYSGAPVGAVSASAPASRIDQGRIEGFSREIMISANGVTNLLGGPIRSPLRHIDETESR